jgi:hypothetical protein
VYGWGGEEQNQTQYKLDSVIGSGDSVISITGMGGYIEISGFGE